MTPTSNMFEFKVQGLCLTIKYKSVRDFTVHPGRGKQDISDRIPFGIKQKIQVSVGRHINDKLRKVQNAA